MTPTGATTHPETVQLGALPPGLPKSERFSLEQVPRAYAAGLAMKNWWLEVDANDSYSDRFPLVYQPGSSYRSFGFLDHAPSGYGDIPIMGSVQDMSWDYPKCATKSDHRQLRRQLREFVFRYFNRVSTYENPIPVYNRTGEARPKPLFPFLSQCQTGEKLDPSGPGFTQLFYQRKGQHQVQAFPPSEQEAFIDMRDLVRDYGWVLSDGRMYDFTLTLHPFGERFLPLVFQDPSVSLKLLMPPYLIVDQDDPEPGVLGVYGLGNCFVPTQSSGSVSAVGPARFNLGISWFLFRLLDTGEIRVVLIFVANQLGQILPLPLNPLEWGFRLGELFSIQSDEGLLGAFRQAANRLPYAKSTFDPVTTGIRALNVATMGRAERNYCISIDELQRRILLVHERNFRKALRNTSRTWQLVPDWLDEEAVPAWARSGLPDGSNGYTIPARRASPAMSDRLTP